jgi:hypothetical protein
MRYITDINSDVSNYTPEQKEILKYSVNRNWGTPVFKMDNFIGNAQYSSFGKLRQFMLELKTREDMVSQMEHGIEKIKLEIELIEEYKSQTSSVAQNKLHDLEIKEKYRNLDNAKNLLTMTYEERDKFMLLITRFNESPEGVLPDGRRIIDIMGDHEEEERLEAELWVNRLGQQAANDLLFYGHVGTGNMEAIGQLAPEDQIKAIECAVEKTITTSQRLEIAHKSVSERLALETVESFQNSEWQEIE